MMRQRKPVPKLRASLGAENIRYKTVSFAGTGAKDVTEYLMDGYTAEELVQLILDRER